MHISNKLPGNGDDAGPGTTPRETLIYLKRSLCEFQKLVCKVLVITLTHNRCLHIINLPASSTRFGFIITENSTIVGKTEGSWCISFNKSIEVNLPKLVSLFKNVIKFPGSSFFMINHLYSMASVITDL